MDKVFIETVYFGIVISLLTYWVAKKKKKKFPYPIFNPLLISAIITITILIILAGITIYIGKESIKKANLEGLKTNMLLIETKAREFVENASFDLGINPQNATDEMKTNAQNELNGESKGTLVNPDDSIINQLLNMGISQEDINNKNVYKLTTENLEKMGINDVKSNDEEGWYVIVYNIDDTAVEIYHTVGYDGKYSLTDIEQIEL